MEDMINLLNQNNIPYSLRDKKENIIIVPNGVIKFKNFQTIRNNVDIMDFAKQLNKLADYYKLPIYAFNYNINEKFLDVCNIINTQIDISRILLCHSISQIIVGDYCYAIRTTGAIWTLVTLFEYYYPIIQNKLILITIETYKRAIVIMTDTELEILHKYNINIINSNIIESSINIIYITQDTFRERELFTFKINYVPLNGGNRSPYRVVEGITLICPQCNNIVYYNSDGIRKHSNCI